jgi:hypothetical protein
LGQLPIHRGADHEPEAQVQVRLIRPPVPLVASRTGYETGPNLVSATVAAPSEMAYRFHSHGSERI